MQNELQAILENPCVLTILNNMTEYVYIVDEQGCLQFINPAVEAFENLTNSEVKGKHIKELYTQGESPTLKALYEQKPFRNTKTFICLTANNTISWQNPFLYLQETNCWEYARCNVT